MPEVTTILNRVNRAISFVESSLTSDYWLGLGNVITPWEEEQIPPSIDPLMQTLPEMIGAVYLNTVSLITEDPNGSIYNDFGRYTAYDLSTSKQTLIDKLVTKVYLACFLDSYKLPIGVSYRSLGLLSNVVINENIQKSLGLFTTVDKISSYELLWVNNVPPKTIQANVLEQLQIIIEF
jgi:hypothetical protein